MILPPFLPLPPCFAPNVCPCPCPLFCPYISGQNRGQGQGQTLGAKHGGKGKGKNIDIIWKKKNVKIKSEICDVTSLKVNWQLNKNVELEGKVKMYGSFAGTEVLQTIAFTFFSCHCPHSLTQCNFRINWPHAVHNDQTHGHLRDLQPH